LELYGDAGLDALAVDVGAVGGSSTVSAGVADLDASRSDVDLGMVT
jgi:hypothetical protein